MAIKPTSKTKKSPSDSSKKPVLKTTALSAKTSKSTAKTVVKSKQVKKPLILSSTTDKKVKLELAKEHKQTKQSFIAFVLLLLVSGFLVGGLLASFNVYQSIVSNNKDATGDSMELPATGLVNEADINAPLPTSNEPGLSNSTDVSTNADSTKQSTTDDKSTGDKRQPAGTVEFNNGDYKVYQYPDGNIVVVW